MKLNKNMTCEEVVEFVSKYPNIKIERFGEGINGYDFCVICYYKNNIQLWICYDSKVDSYFCEITFIPKDLVVTPRELDYLFGSNVFIINKICDKHFESILKKCDKYYDQIIEFNKKEEESLNNISIESVQKYYNDYMDKIRLYITKLSNIKSTDYDVVSTISKYLKLLSRNLETCMFSYDTITNVFLSSELEQRTEDRLRYKLSCLKNFNIYTGSGMWDKSISEEKFNEINHFINCNI